MSDSQAAVSGWQVAQLGEIFEIKDRERIPVNANARSKRSGGVPYYGATGQVGWIDDYIFDEELVLLGEDGAPFLEAHRPKAYVIRGRAWVNNHAHVLRALQATPSLFWKYQLDQVNFHRFVSGTTRLKLPQGPMRQIPLLVPPLPEQHRIVEAIESYFTRLDDAVATLDRVQRNLKRYRASVLKAAVEGRLVPTEADLARAEGRDLPEPRPGHFFVYAIERGNGEFYVGHTEDLLQSWQEHLAGHACEGTREPGPKRVAHWEVVESRDAALLREKQLKTAAGRKWLRQEIAAGRARQAGYEPASVLLRRILAERRRRWEEAELAKMKAQGKPPRDDKWKARYKEPVAPDTAGLPQLPEGWCWANGSQMTEVITKGSSPRWQGFDYCTDGIPFIRSQNVRWGHLDLDDLAHLPKSFNEKEKKSVLRTGDVLLNIVGASIGRAAVATNVVEGGNTNQAVAIVRPAEGMLSSFLCYYLTSPACQRIIHETKVDVARANLSLEDIGSLPIPVPPSDEQARIAEEVEHQLSVIAEGERAILANSSRCARLRQSILKWAFEGRLVDQDPTDEPASVLLERIRAERQAKPARSSNASRRTQATRRART